MAKKKSTTTPSKTTKAKSTRKPKAPKKDINDMQVADGKDSLAQSIEEVKDLEQLRLLGYCLVIIELILLKIFLRK